MPSITALSDLVPDVTMGIFDAIAAEPRWLTVIGLTFDIVGVVVIAVGVFAPKKQLIEQHKESGTAYYGGPSEETVQKGGAFKDRFRQSKTAVWGALLLLVGFALQVFGAWPR